MSTSLYRKYRSRGFNEIVGQSHVTDLLASAVKNGAISHAYLFTGPRGTGKTSVARILAHRINDLPYDDDAVHLDIIEIDAASNRRIDDIRDLRDKVHIAPTSAKYKVYIIDEVHMLTGESFNALLKTLEEPPAHAVFILATTELHKVPATIVSRTQRFHFRPGAVSDIVAHLAAISKKESIRIDNDALELIARHSEGGFRDSVSLLDQASSLGGKMITRSDIESLLGLAPQTVIGSIINSIISGDSAGAIHSISGLIDEGVHPAHITDQLLKAANAKAPGAPVLYDLILRLIDIPRSHLPQLKLIAAIASIHPPKPSPATAKPDAPEPDAPSAETPARHEVSPKPKSEPKSEPKPKPKPAMRSAKDRKDQPAVSEAARADFKASNFKWSDVLADLKKSHAPLYNIARHATATARGTTLTLAFHYTLYRKKMQSEASMAQLAQAIAARYGEAPEIVVTAEQPAALDTETAAVADIMGGGEAVKLES